MSKLPGRNVSKRTGGLVIEKLWKPSLQFGGEGSIDKLNWHSFVLFQRGDSDSMVTRTYQATGEALLAPARNYRKVAGPITSNRWEVGLR
jgi:hypothetical protein